MCIRDRKNDERDDGLNESDDGPELLRHEHIVVEDDCEACLLYTSLSRLKAVAMDMNASFNRLFQKYCPKAPIVYDLSLIHI